MKLTRQRAASLGLLAVAVAALAVDRLFLGAGAPATAAAAEVQPLETTAAATQLGVRAAGPGLATRLEAIAAAEQLDTLAVHDLFTERAKDVPWRLRSIVGTGERVSVMVDGEWVRLGDAYAGARLVEVTREGATFLRDGKELFVPLDRPRPATDRPILPQGESPAPADAPANS